MALTRKKILLFTDWYEPGYKAGGPIRSCVHFVQQMQEGYTIYIFTTDRDLNATESYENITVNTWIGCTGPGAQVFYCSPGMLSWKHIRQQIQSVNPDFIYLNSMFSKYFTIYPLLMYKFGWVNGKIVLAPRGMLKASALQFKGLKKKLFLSVFKKAGLHKPVYFHATDNTEWQDIQHQFGENVKGLLAPNFPGVVNTYPESITKKEKELSIVFVGRLHPVKNLDYLLKLLPRIQGKISLTIVGSEENAAYTIQCKEVIKNYPSGISVVFAGEIPNHQLPDLIAQHHIFMLPTQGENFGHAIFEALAAGKPVLISDQTPWRNLTTYKAGWDIPLQKKDQFVTALQQAMDFDQAQYNEWSLSAWQYVHDLVKRSDLKTTYYKLFS